MPLRKPLDGYQVCMLAVISSLQSIQPIETRAKAHTKVTIFNANTQLQAFLSNRNTLTSLIIYSDNSHNFFCLHNNNPLLYASKKLKI